MLMMRCAPRLVITDEEALALVSLAGSLSLLQNRRSVRPGMIRRLPVSVSRRPRPSEPRGQLPQEVDVPANASLQAGFQLPFRHRPGIDLGSDYQRAAWSRSGGPLGLLTRLDASTYIVRRSQAARGTE
jgi:hypothetical protein